MKTILVVDDLESVRFYHQLLLTQAGFTALTAADGLEALALLERHAVDLVMLDLLMPRMSGPEFLERARALPGRGGLPVLVISSENQNGAAAALRGTARCEVLQKPILPDTLLSTVQRILG